MRQRPGSRLRRLVLCAALALSSRGAAGQAARKLELHVIDSVSGAPVGHAEVRVLRTLKDTAGWMIRQTADSDDVFGLALAPAAAPACTDGHAVDALERGAQRRRIL